MKGIRIPPHRFQQAAAVSVYGRFQRQCLAVYKKIFHGA
jgi:hypothetical protein